MVRYGETLGLLASRTLRTGKADILMDSFFRRSFRGIYGGGNLLDLVYEGIDVPGDVY